MLTKLTVRNFKRFGHAEIELGSPVVFVGPNNSGKTTALQALALWGIGVQRWTEKCSGRETPEKRPGVTVNRRDLVAVPVPEAKLLWRDLHVRDVRRVEGKTTTANVRVEIVVEGVTGGQSWTCGFEFDYANPESLYCRPLRLDGGKTLQRMPVPEAASAVRIAYLPPMSGLAATEVRLDPGAIDVRVGEGRTAEVLRNVCHNVHRTAPDRWRAVVDQMESLFGTRVDPPRYVPQRGEVAMSYREGDTRLDLPAAGRGFQQTLLLLAYMHANPGAVLLLDEPDAHLEVLRQRQMYGVLVETARSTGGQIVAATHSEVVLNEAAGRDTVVAFVGEPHRIDDRGSQVAKALKEIGFEDYYQAEQTGWVLYLEGSTDLAILQRFARRLGHDAAIRALERPLVRYVGNQAGAVGRHFHGMREAVPGLRGVAIFDRLATGVPEVRPVHCLMWERREIENYLCVRAALEAYATASAEKDVLVPLSLEAEVARRTRAMEESISETEAALATLGKGSPWGSDLKVSDEFLTPVFRTYHRKLALPNLVAKTNFHVLVEHVPKDDISPEVGQKLDAIAQVAQEARDDAD